MDDAHLRRLIFLWLAWTLLNAAAWGLATLAGFGVGWQPLKTTADLLAMAPALIGSGLVLGLILAAGEALVLRSAAPAGTSWAARTLLGYALGLPLAFYAAVGIVWLMAGRSLGLFVAGSGASLLPPLSLQLVLLGLWIGWLQMPVLAKVEASKGPVHASLWLLGNAVATGLGYWAAVWVGGQGAPPIAANAALGLLAGATGAAVLAVLLHRPPAVAGG